MLIFYQFFKTILEWILEPTWGRLGTSGTSWAALRVSWARLGRVSGASSGRLGGVLALGVVLRPFLKHFGTILG